jgi:sec-independent protein translocase protein TatC
MCMLAIPMSLLFELSVLLAWLHDRRKARREAENGFGDLTDDEISPLDVSVAPVDEPTSLDPPVR